jgi:leader peptidase (prepilin peptidase)/N-methyltransferase
MGMGDVKLAAVMGLFLGRDVAPGLLTGIVAATVVGVVVMARKGVKEGRKTAIPFGPFLALGGLIGLFAGAPIVDWYLSTMGL